MFASNDLLLCDWFCICVFVFTAVVYLFYVCLFGVCLYCGVIVVVCLLGWLLC